MRLATLQLTMNAPDTDVTKLQVQGELEGQPASLTVAIRLQSLGLGTLVREGDHLWIITHDHWSWIDNPGTVQFRNAWGELLLELTGEEFLQHIRYRDGGTLVLEAPRRLTPEFLETLSHSPDPPFHRAPHALHLGDAAGPAVGEVVYLAYRMAEDQVGVFAARVESVDRGQAFPLFRLVSLSGGALAQGDSGGGVRLDGRLVGNNWATQVLPTWTPGAILSGERGERPTGVSFAAGLPAALDAAHPNALIDAPLLSIGESGSMDACDPC